MDQFPPLLLLPQKLRQQTSFARNPPSLLPLQQRIQSLVDLLRPFGNHPVGVVQAAVQSPLDRHQRWLGRRVHDHRAICRPPLAVPTSVTASL